MDDVHTTHRTAGIVEEPLLGVIVLRVDVVRVLLVQLGDDVIDNGGGVIGVSIDSPLGEVVQVFDVEEVEALEVLLDQVDDGAQYAN